MTHLTVRVARFVLLILFVIAFITNARTYASEHTPVATITGTQAYIFGADVTGGKLAVDDSNLIVGGVGMGWSAHLIDVGLPEAWSPTVNIAHTMVGLGFAPIAQSVAIDRNFAIVGTKLDDVNGIYSGSAQVFRRQSDEWAPMPKFTPSDGKIQDFFGDAVAIHGTRAVVGAPGADDVYLGSGAAYVFELDASDRWRQIAKLQANDGFQGDEAGRSVALVGSTVLVAAPLDDSDLANSGSVYAYREFAPGNWSQVGKLRPSDLLAESGFGYSLAADGSQVLVGAPHSNNFPLNSASGAAYLYDFDDNGGWKQIARFAPSTPTDANFGVSVAIHGSLAVVGAGQDSSSLSRTSAAYVFRDDGNGNWSEIARISPDEPIEIERFGMGVATNGRSVFIA